MKKICTRLLIVCSLFLMSCDKFLDLKPKDQKVVSTIEDYRDIMASYMRLLKEYNIQQEKIFGIDAYTFPLFDVALNLGVYTGETNLSTNYSTVYDKVNGKYTMNGKNMLTWRMTDSYAWQRYYQFLGPINLIISGIAEADGTDEDLRNYVKGEALVWRAFSYFKLLQYYAPYKDDIYGVPVYLTPEQDVGTAMPKRRTQTEVFEQILNDCDEVLRLLELTASNNWNCAYRYDFVCAMLASIYTWKAMSAAAEDSDWVNAEKYASEAMRGKHLANSVEVLKMIFDSYNIRMIENDEFCFRVVSSYYTGICDFPYAYYDGIVDGYVNSAYYDKFKSTDIRRMAWFSEDGTRSDKYSLLGRPTFGASYGCVILFRLAEMYLIKAEALVRMGKVSDAQNVLREFCDARYTEKEDIPADEETLLQAILDERIREFYMENDFRWLDMKRLGVSMERIVNGERYVLESDDFRYCFPIPAKELELNKNMVQTPGWDRIVL